MVRRLALIFVITVCCAAPSSGAGEEENPLLSSGLALYEQGKYPQAFQLFFEAFLEEPQNSTVNIHLGQAAYAMGDYEAAIMAFERVLIIDPQAKEMKLEMARAYVHLGATELAVEYLDDLLQAGLSEEVCGQARQLLEEIRPPQSR